MTTHNDPWRGCLFRPDAELAATLRRKEVSTEPDGVAQKAEQLLTALIGKLRAITTRKTAAETLAAGQQASLARLRNLGTQADRR